MKKIALNLAAFLALVLITFPAKAQQTEWTIVTASESAANAEPVSYDVNGDAINCSSQNADNQNAWDAGHVGPQGDCYDPLIITFDLNMPAGTNWGPVNAASLDSGSLNLLSMTNSIGSSDGGVSSITVQLKSGTYYITVTNEDGSVFTFTATEGGSPMSASFVSKGGSSNLDKGKANVFSSFLVASGTYAGQFDHGNSDAISIISGAQPAANFSLNTITVTATGSKNTCFTHSFSTSDPTAQSYGTDYISGDMAEFVVGDGHGNVIWIIATPGTNAQGVFGISNSTDLYLSFTVVASTNNSCAAGLSAYDSPFHRVLAIAPRPPVRFPVGRPLLSR